MRPWFRGEDRLRIEQEMTDDSLVVRAEIPGVDPQKDIDITVENGMLRIHAERSYENKEEKEGRTRSEFRYGSFERTMRLPDDVKSDEVKATYKDGILEVTVPCRGAAERAPQKIEVTKG
jgi:HSP20 family protein